MMRKLIVAIATATLLALPSGAAAHTAYMNVTLDPEATITGENYEAMCTPPTLSCHYNDMSCSEAQTINPNETWYLDGGIVDPSLAQTSGARQWGFAFPQFSSGAWHWHPYDWRQDTGFATEKFAAFYGAELAYAAVGTRRIAGWTESGFDYHMVLKVVATSNNRQTRIIRNC